MKHFAVIAVALALGAAGCSKDSTTTPTPVKPTFTADLRTSNENPPITNAEQGGSGTATITFDVTKDAAGNVTGGTANFVVNLTGFPAGTPINIAHIHEAAAGTNGSIVVNSLLTAGTVVLGANGAGTFTASNLTVDAALANRILTNPAGFYFNVHSTLNPGGVARGQLVKVS